MGVESLVGWVAKETCDKGCSKRPSIIQGVVVQYFQEASKCLCKLPNVVLRRNVFFCRREQSLWHSLTISFVFLQDRQIVSGWSLPLDGPDSVPDWIDDVDADDGAVVKNDDADIENYDADTENDDADTEYDGSPNQKMSSRP